MHPHRRAKKAAPKFAQGRHAASMPIPEDQYCRNKRTQKKRPPDRRDLGQYLDEGRDQCHQCPYGHRMDLLDGFTVHFIDPLRAVSISCTSATPATILSSIRAAPISAVAFDGSPATPLTPSGQDRGVSSPLRISFGAKAA